MVDFKVHSFKTFKPNKVFLLIILFWCYTNLCSASGIGNVPYISYISPMLPKPMSIRTKVEPILPTDGQNALGEISPMFIPGRRAQFLSNSSKFSFKKFLTYQGIIIKPIFYVKIENLVNRKYLSNSIVITQDNYGCIENQYLLRKNPKFKLGVSLSIVQEKVMHFKIRASYGVGRTVENKSVTTSFLYNL